jgi:hypothetical protein
VFPETKRQTNGQKPGNSKTKEHTTNRADKYSCAPKNLGFIRLCPHLLISCDRVLMNNDIGCRDDIVDIGLNFLGHPMRFGQGHTPFHLKMKLNYVGLPGTAGADIMDPVNPMMRQSNAGYPSLDLRR